MKLRDVGEDRLLEQLLPKLAQTSGLVLGAGDDCAILEPGKGDRLGMLKTDCLVEGIHFAKSTPPQQVGWKAMARPLSDFAAMSGLPEFALVTLIVPGTRDVAWVRRLYRGIDKAARRFDVAVVGGEMSNIKGPAVISISLTGCVERRRWVGRAGGGPGDELYVTGRLGGSLGSGHHLKFVPRIPESRWLTENFRIHAMMDLSDGLGADLPRLARMSKVGYEVDITSIPLSPGCTRRQAISDGEDYELLFAISPTEARTLPARWAKKFPDLRLTRIGRLNRASKIKNRKLPRGYVHFQKR
jgi:thiamine-monophosphate kinase